MEAMDREFNQGLQRLITAIRVRQNDPQKKLTRLVDICFFEDISRDSAIKQICGRMQEDIDDALKIGEGGLHAVPAPATLSLSRPRPLRPPRPAYVAPGPATAINPIQRSIIASPHRPGTSRSS